MSGAIRQKPNAFHLWHQMKLAKLMGRESVAGLEACCGLEEFSICLDMVSGVGESQQPRRCVSNWTCRSKGHNGALQVCGCGDCRESSRACEEPCRQQPMGSLLNDI